MLNATIWCLLVLGSISDLRGQTSQTYQDFFKSSFGHFQANELDAALVDIDKAIELNPHSVDAYVLRSVIRNKRSPEAEDSADWDKIIELAPSAQSTEQFYVARSNYRARQQKWNDALDDLNKAVSLNPKTAINYNFRSFVQLMRGDLVNARADYEKSLEIDSTLRSPLVMRGFIRYQAKDFDGALADFIKAIEWKSDCAEAYADRGIVLGLQGNMDDALREIRLAAALSPHSISDRIPKDTYTAPFWELNHFIKRNPSNARAHQLLGIFRLLQHKETEATGAFRRALELEPPLKAEIDRINAALRH